MNKVRIYGTLGPACREPEIIRRMFEEGMDGARLNLSHTTLEESADLISEYRKAAAECGISDPELLIDMQGPELRIGRLPQPLLLRSGDLISPDDIMLPREIQEVLESDLAEYRHGCPCDGRQDKTDSGKITGRDILLDDGKILLRSGPFPDADGEEMSLRVIRGGMLAGRKSAALPGCNIHTPTMTESDKENIKRLRKFGVTAVMQPFVRSKEDLEEVRREMDRCGCEDVRLFAKIENMDGVRKLEELIPYCDQIVIARGDLGNAMELWELPAVQKRISAACRRAGREFMVVTQMLDSMVHSRIPTRAEVSDIFNAVLDGAASVMVTGETASGEHPVLAIRYLSRTAREAEAFME